MTALEKLKEIEERDNPRPFGTWKDPEELVRFSTAVGDRHFLLKAIKVWREIAIEKDYRHGISMEIPRDMTVRQAQKEVSAQIAKETDKEFEKRMKE